MNLANFIKSIDWFQSDVSISYDSNLYLPTSLSWAPFFKKDLALRNRTWQQLVGSEMARRKMKRNLWNYIKAHLPFWVLQMHKVIAGPTDLGKCYSYVIFTLYFLNPILKSWKLSPLSTTVHRHLYFQVPPLKIHLTSVLQHQNYNPFPNPSSIFKAHSRGTNKDHILLNIQKLSNIFLIS